METSPTFIISKLSLRRKLAAILIGLLLISQFQAASTVFASTAQVATTNGISATGVDGLSIITASGISATGVDGISATGVDGTTYLLDSIFIQRGNGISATGVDGISATGVDGISATGVDSFGIALADGISATGVDSLFIFAANGISATGVDGSIITIPDGRLTIVGIDALSSVGIIGLLATGVDTVTGLVNTVTELIGLQTIETTLASLLNRLTDDSNVGAAIVYHRLPTDADLNDLRKIGILGGSRYRALPVIVTTTTKRNLMAASKLPAVRSIYGNRTLELLAEPGRGQTGVERMKTDPDLLSRNQGSALTGRGVTVAVIDSGLNGMHSDLSGRIVQNVKLGGALAGISLGFTYPISVENLSNTDLLSGHGTFVGGVIAGNGARSNGKFKGVAPGAKLLGLSAGDFNLFYVLEGLDYLLWKGAQYGVKVVNCSFSADTEYDPNDPVNIATKMLTDQGINVVFSAGNTGPGSSTLNPYAMAPWVISVGATDERGRLAGFSARGDFKTPNARPTVVAPGVNIISLRSNLGLNLTSILGGQWAADQQYLTSAEMPYYATSSGTSFAAPQVAGAIALLLEANPELTPAQVRSILMRSSVLMPPYNVTEVGAGMLNVHAAALEAAFPTRRMGMFRSVSDQGQARFISDPVQMFGGVVQPLGAVSTNHTIPANTLNASFTIQWQNTLLNDLGLKVYNPAGVMFAESNILNLPLLNARQEGVLVYNPSAGVWRSQVKQTIPLLATAQAFMGQFQTTRVEYAEMTDVSTMSPSSQAEVYQNLRSFVMKPMGRRFRPSFTVSRYDLASALVLGGRIPQYLPAQPRYTDAVDAATMPMVESAQSAPTGVLFPDADPGGAFRPNDRANRLAAAIALVRAAGLGAMADSLAGTALPYSDQAQIPSQYRGYVSVAISKGLLGPDGGAFSPAKPLTRVELSHAMATLAKMATN